MIDNIWRCANLIWELAEQDLEREGCPNQLSNVIVFEKYDDIDDVVVCHVLYIYAFIGVLRALGRDETVSLCSQ